MVSILCLFSPAALGYGFHARRQAKERVLAWTGLILSLLVFLVFGLVMLSAVVSLGVAICQ